MFCIRDLTSHTRMECMTVSYETTRLDHDNEWHPVSPASTLFSKRGAGNRKQSAENQRRGQHASLHVPAPPLVWAWVAVSNISRCVSVTQGMADMTRGLNLLGCNRRFAPQESRGQCPTDSRK